MAQVKRQDSLGTLSDLGSSVRLSDARITIGGRQYQITQLDQAYPALSNDTTYRVDVTAVSETPAIVISETEPGTAYKQVGEIVVDSSGGKTFTESSEGFFPIATATTYGVVKSAKDRSSWTITNTTLTSGVPIDFDTTGTIVSQVGTWSHDGAGTITIPSTGVYSIGCNVGTSGAFYTADRSLTIFRNGSLTTYIDYAGGNDRHLGSSCLIEYQAGDTIHVEINDSQTLATQESQTHLVIVKL